MTITRLLWVLLLTLSACELVLAHELRPSVADISIGSSNGNHNASVSLRANLEKLIAEIGTDHDDTDSSPNRQRYDALRALDSASLNTEFTNFITTFTSAFNIHNNSGERIDLRNISVDIPDTGNTAIPRDSIIKFDLALQSTDQAITWQWNETFGEIIIRADDTASDTTFSALLSDGQRSSSISLGQITVVTLKDTISNYIVVGFQHIIPKGLDHILFVVGLFLLTSKAKPLLLQVTIFTIAHSITLLLATLDILTIPGSIVEPLIAASIVFVCVENVFQYKATRWRLAIVFIFGLLHGLGFASVLGEVGLDVQNFFTALLAFNVGVELGQICVIAGCYLVFGLWAGKDWYRRYLSLPASVVIGGVGLYWFVERVSG